MKTLTLAFLVAACGGSSPAPASSPAAPPASSASSQNQQMLELMDRYVADAFADPDAPRRIVQFAVESHDVSVILDDATAPFVTDESIAEDARNRLLTAYMAGNAGAQLRSGRKGDDIHAGVAAVLKVYAQSKTRDPKLVIPDLDKLKDMEAKGTLKAHLDGIAAARAKK
jgi:hypothetical protein